MSHAQQRNASIEDHMYSTIQVSAQECIMMRHVAEWAWQVEDEKVWEIQL